MRNVIYGQYDSNKYPLKRFTEQEIPNRIRNILVELNNLKLAVFRGGLAFVFLTRESRYILKDIDMMAYSRNKDKIIYCLKCADFVYVNKNTFGNEVITAFWRNTDDFYKLDILLTEEMPSLCKKNINRKEVCTVSASYVWRNRIEKIAEKEQRKHDDKKTLNHFNAAFKLSKYLIENNDEICETDIAVVRSKLTIAQKVLSSLITEKELGQFIKIQLELVRS